VENLAVPLLWVGSCSLVSKNIQSSVTKKKKVYNIVNWSVDLLPSTSAPASVESTAEELDTDEEIEKIRKESSKTKPEIKVESEDLDTDEEIEKIRRQSAAVVKNNETYDQVQCHKKIFFVSDTLENKPNLFHSELFKAN
jgi:hypothetical protein